VTKGDGRPLAPGEYEILLFRAGVAGKVPNDFKADSFQGAYYRLTAVPERSLIGLYLAAVLMTTRAFIRRRLDTELSSSVMNR